MSSKHCWRFMIILGLAYAMAAQTQAKRFQLFSSPEVVVHPAVNGRVVIDIEFPSGPLPPKGDVYVAELQDRDGANPEWRSLADFETSGAIVRNRPGAYTVELLSSPKAVRVASGESDVFAESEVTALVTCQPQCTTYVQSRTKISFSKCWGRLYGDAGSWVTYAKKCGFSTSTAPKVGSIGEMASPGHVFLVKYSKLISSYSISGSYSDYLRGDIYIIYIADANWNLKCGLRSGVPLFVNKGVAYKYYNERTKVLSGAAYPLTGFIRSW